MGKSPGKWIKTVLFGKKSSKSNFLKNVTMEKNAAAKTPAEDLSVNSQLSSDLPSQVTDRCANNVECEKATNSGTPRDNADLLSLDQVVDAQSTLDLNSIDTADLRRQEEASTKAQAAFRGYLARRAFRALKGIIRLQALIRGHLVRRQAVVTFHCMHAIVKFQALARGRIVRLSCPMPGVLRKYNSGEIQNAKRVDTFGVISSHGSENLTTNAFSLKLLASLPTAMPLSLQYDLAEPNSAWNWLERWSESHFWQPTARAKEIVDVKSQQKQAGALAVETKAGKSKRTVRKVSATANGDNSALASTHLDKPKRKPKKVITHQTEPVQDQPQNEHERFKHNLRKVSTSVQLASEKLETQTEKSNPSLEKVPNSAADISEQIVKSSENSVYSNAVVDEQALSGAPSPNTENVLQSNHPVQPQTLENGEMEMNPAIDDELGSKEKQTGKENQKTRRRSLPPKHEFPENVLQNTPGLPSYMQATESAKAKLRAQGASKLSEDGSENGSVRRHSLPSSANGKLNSLSPRVQRLVQANDKGGSKSNKSLMSSKDDKGLQPGWRR